MTNEPARQPDGGGTYLRGGPGEPTLLITDHVSDREARYRQQLREVQDREIKDLLAKVERTAVARRFTQPPSPAEVALEQARGEAWVASAMRSREEPARLAKQQEELEAWAASADPVRQGAQRGRAGARAGARRRVRGPEPCRGQGGLQLVPRQRRRLRGARLVTRSWPGRPPAPRG
jgi:hypothetical protein